MKAYIKKYTHKYKGQTATLKKRGRNWNISWMFDGQHIRQSLKTPNITDAKTLAEALIEKAVRRWGSLRLPLIITLKVYTRFCTTEVWV